ncbi:MAG: RIP metalloprotease RseP [Rubellimicrobium sp.]|nr:RIP metalloprotease RseP [Rubellimicrobium sp.]
MTQLLPQFGNLGFTLLAFILALSVIVAIHEYGHYIVGRWSGIHAEVFSLGFGPVLFRRTDRHGTVWQVAALPLGGYVKFLGDANAASVGSVDDVDPAERRRTMLGAPLWARSATVAAGPVFNFILTVMILFGLALTQGRPVEPVRITELVPLPESFASDLRPGDEVLAIAGLPVSAPGGIEFDRDALPLEARMDYTIRRDGREMVVEGPHPLVPRAGSINPNSPAWRAGIRPGDVITAGDGVPVFAFDQLIDAVNASEGRVLALDVWRAGEMLRFDVAPRYDDLPDGEGGFTQRWLMGISGGLFFEVERARPGLGEALAGAVGGMWNIILSSLSGLWHVLTGGISTCNLSGPVGIAEASGAMAAQGVGSFIRLIAVLSTAVGLLNLFPIPILDGGHLVFHAYEGVTGRPPGEKALRILMIAGLSIILSLMVFALLNDILFCR